MMDDMPTPRPAIALGDDLTACSIEELEERIEALKTEITRVEGELASKRAGRAAADAVFGGR